MKWKEVTQFSELLSSESSANYANQINNNAHHRQKEKTLSFTSKTETILNQVWRSKFIFTKRSLVCYLLGRNIKIPDQHGRKPPTTIKGYLAFQNEKIVQMFVNQMIAKQIFIQKKIQNQSKRSKHIIVPMSLDQYYLLKNSNLCQKLIIEIPLSVIMNQQIKANNRQKKQSRFSQFLGIKKQNQIGDQDCSELCKVKYNEHKQCQLQIKSGQNNGQKLTNLSKSKNRTNEVEPFQNFRFKNCKAPLQSFGFDKINKKNQEQNLLPRRQNQFSQKKNLFQEQEKKNQFWLRQNQSLLQQFGYIKDSLSEQQKNINEMHSKQQMILMMKQIKDKQKTKKINIPNYLFFKSQNKFSDNNAFQKQSERNQFIIQNHTKQKDQQKRYQKRQKIVTVNMFSAKFIQKSQKKIINIEKQSQKDSERQSQTYYQNKKQFSNSQQSRTITLQNHHRFRNNQNDRRSSGNSHNSNNIKLKHYFDKGQIGNFWDQIFQNPKFNYQLTQKSIKHSQCVQIPEESQNSQTMTLQKSGCKKQYNIRNDDCDFRDISYELNTNFSQQVKFQQNKKSFSQQTNFQLNNQKFLLQANFQQNSHNQEDFFQQAPSDKINDNFKHKNNHINQKSYINQKQNKIWRMPYCRKSLIVKQQSNLKPEQYPQLYQVNSDYSDTFDKTKTIFISNNKNFFNSNKQPQCGDFENKKFNRSSNIYLPQKIQIEYPKRIDQVQRSTCTVTVGRNTADSFYYSSEKQRQEHEQQRYKQSELHYNNRLCQKNYIQNLGQNTVTIVRKEYQNQQLQNFWFNNKQNSYNQFQDFKGFKIQNAIQQLDI